MTNNIQSLKEAWEAESPLTQEQAWEIFIRDLQLQASIGIHPHEKRSRQPIVINLRCEVWMPNPEEEGDDQRYVCYEHLMRRIEAMIFDNHFNLVETLVEKIANLSLEDKRIRRVWIRVEKVNVFQNCGSVGVEIERVRRRPHVATS